MIGKKRDRCRKPIYKFKKENFQSEGKKCNRCGKRRTFHHYLCDSCWEKNRKEELKRRLK